MKRATLGDLIRQMITMMSYIGIKRDQIATIHGRTLILKETKPTNSETLRAEIGHLSGQSYGDADPKIVLRLSRNELSLFCSKLNAGVREFSIIGDVPDGAPREKYHIVLGGTHGRVDASSTIVPYREIPDFIDKVQRIKAMEGSYNYFDYPEDSKFSLIIHHKQA